MIRHALVFLLLTTAFVGGAQELAPVDRAAIMDIAVKSDAAWNERDAERLAAFFTADGDNQILGTPVDLEGRQAIADYFKASLAKVDPAMRHVTAVRELHWVTPDVVVSDVDVKLEKTADGVTSVVRKFAGTAVLLRTAEGWKIRVNRVRAVG